MARSRKTQAQKIVNIGCALAIIAVLAVIGYFVVDLVRNFDSDFLARGEVTTVPAIVGLSPDEAEQAIRTAGFKPDRRESVVSDTVEKGLVMKQDPEAGRKRKAGGKISYYLSLGNPRYVVPDLEGKELAQATILLDEAGMKIGRIEKIYMPADTPGTVISQDPVKGKEFPGPVSVDLRVADSRDLPKVEMPDLSGKDLRSAEQLLVRSNLHLHQVDYVSNNSVESGTVLSQNVRAGEQISLGQKVTLTVAAPPELISSWTRTITVRVPVSGGPRMQHVKIKVFDQIAQNTIVYDQMHESGSFVDKRIPLEGKATVMVYIDDMENAFREERIPYDGGEEE
ncbi:PASTA domain-containing protein [bacterium]|nr:PASTA domain-containing protein [bacterium]